MDDRHGVPHADEPQQATSLELTEQVRSVLDGLPGMVGFWDRELRNVLANRAYVEYFGYTPERMRGIHIRELLGEELFAANVPFMAKALAGQEQLFDRTLTDQQGRQRHMQASYVPHRVGTRVDGFFVLVTDVTERVEAERNLQRSSEMYRALASNIPSGFVLLFDADLRFLIADGPELKTFGFTPASLEGHTLHDAFPAQLATELEPRYRAALAGHKVEWERQVQDRIFSLTAGPVSTEASESFAAMVIAQDVTAQRRTQASWAALHEIATSVARNAAPEMIVTQIAISLKDIFNVHTSAVVRFAGREAGDIVAMAPSQPESVPQRLHFRPEDWSATAQVAHTGKPALVDYQAVEAGLVGALRSEGLLTGAAAPIHHDGVLWGAIALGAERPGQLTQDVLAQLASFAELVEIALGNMQAWSSLVEQAATDPLTGLPNRRSFEEQLARESQRFRRKGRPFSVVLIDIDHFKDVNDTYGHPAGDRALIEVAERLKSVARNSELVARLGGEEFVWLLPETNERGAMIAAERARLAIAEREFDGIGALTVSLGVCSTDQVPDCDGIMQAADTALYEAKRTGRDRAVLHRDPADAADSGGYWARTGS
jgi:diguanylate cyclase (GGDEF)-like protein/PAS domain S-box-containing protein